MNSTISEEQKVKAAISIQRVYRFYRMRKHFSKILDNIEQRTDIPKSNFINLILGAHSRRRSVLMWMHHNKDMVRSHEKFSLSTLAKAAETDLPIEPSPVPDMSHFSTDSVNELPVFKHNERPHTPKIIPSHTLSATSPDLSQSLNALKEKKTRKYINEFNMDANKGMINLVKNDCVQNDPEAIAKFLLSDDRLSKTKIGEYLGGGDDFQNTVLRCFVQQLDFTGLEFDDALRKLLRTFRLPGEAQKIDRVMNEFAQKYCRNNPGRFSNSDTAYILAYSLIMLNTDAHNTNVKKKMSLADFLRNNRGIDNKQDLPEDFMKKLYSNIVNNEIKMNEHDNVFKINELCSKIEGKIENIAETHRRIIKEFFAQQITDYQKPNVHRHERHLIIFNDLLLVLKPKSMTAYTMSSTNSDKTKTQISSTLPSSSSERTSASTAYEPSIMSETKDGYNNKFQFRHLFNFITMNIVDRQNNQFHENVVELNNINGILLLLSFTTKEEKSQFIKIMKEYIEEVLEYENEKKQKLTNLTKTRVSTAKAVLEKIYQMENFEKIQQEQTHTELIVSNTLSEQDYKSRFSKYGNLRSARMALQAQSRLITGKTKKATQKQQHTVPPELEGLEKQLSQFGVQVKLLAASPSPDVQQQQIIMISPDEEEENSSQDIDGAIAFLDKPISPRESNKLGLPGMSDEKRKRRNTVTGYNLDVINIVGKS